MNGISGLRTRYFDVAVLSGAYTTRGRLQNHLSYMFGDTMLKDRKVLDVGGGTGLLTLWAAVEGADAVCLEPESAGATQSVRKVFERMKAEISPSLKAEMFEDPVQNYLAARNEKFDVIVMANSVNHIAEEECAKLLTDEKSQRIYVAFFEQVRSHLVPGGKLIVTDCGRRNFFGDMGLRSPVMPSINWSIHQSPVTWRQLMEQAGLEVSSVQWTTPNSLGSLGRSVFGNRLSAYFLLSHFRIVAQA